MNHKYVDIKSQKISPEGKAKIQLQIVMHDGACTTFHFNNPSGGADAQKKERDDVKELLQQLLPTFKKKVNKELEEKNRMLSENPGLLQVKFMYSEKATQFCKIFPLLLTVCTVIKSKGNISQNFVAFSEYMNFKTVLSQLDCNEIDSRNFSL